MGYRLGEARILLDPKNRIVKWDVPENNHAVDYANEHGMAMVFWNAINAVVWTRGTGGRTWGSNEYADDAERDGGYSSDHTKQRWGNLTKAVRQLR